jgi:hypothetical protein
LFSKPLLPGPNDCGGWVVRNIAKIIYTEQILPPLAPENGIRMFMLRLLTGFISKSPYIPGQPKLRLAVTLSNLDHLHPVRNSRTKNNQRHQQSSITCTISPK